MVAVDIDGSVVRSDYTYDVPRFKRILSHYEKKKGVILSWLVVISITSCEIFFLDIMMSCHLWLRMGAFVKDHKEMVFTADMPKETVDLVIDVCREYPEILNVLCGAESAYCQRGSVSQEFFDLAGIYYHRLKWVDDLKSVNDRILKFAPTVPEEKTYYYYEIFRERLRAE